MEQLRSVVRADDRGGPWSIGEHHRPGTAAAMDIEEAGAHEALGVDVAEDRVLEHRAHLGRVLVATEQVAELRRPLERERGLDQLELKARVAAEQRTVHRRVELDVDAEAPFRESVTRTRPSGCRRTCRVGAWLHERFPPRTGLTRRARFSVLRAAPSRDS